MNQRPLFAGESGTPPPKTVQGYRAWPGVPTEVQRRAIDRFRGLLAGWGLTSRPNQNWIGVREGLGAQAKLWAESGHLESFDSPALWSWVEKQLAPEGAYRGRNLGWAWKDVCMALANGLAAKKRQVARERGEQQRLRTHESQTERRRRMRVLLDRASAGDERALAEYQALVRDGDAA